MPLDPSISLQTQAANPTNFISGFLDLGQKKINLDKSRATFDADVAQRQADSSTAQSAATVNAANVQPLIAQQAATTSTAQTGAQTAKNALTSQQAQIAFQQAGGLLQDPAVVAGSDSEAVARAVLGAKSRAVDQGLDPFKAEVMFGRLVTQAHDDPKGFKDVLANTIRGGTPSASQGANATPSGPMINNGQTFGGVNTNPLAAGGVGSPIPGTGGSVQLPPSAPSFDPRTNSPGYLGSQAPQSNFKDPTGALRQIQAMPPGPARDEALAAAGNPVQPRVQSGPALGVAEGVAGTTASNVSHWDGVSKDAAAAPTRIGVLENIKALAPGAVTGDQPAIRKIVSKLAGYLGLKYDEQTATDVMAKEAALLASKGGNTDMARLLNEAATPGAHMTKDAIQTTADQLIGQEKLKVAAQSYFGSTSPNDPLYTQKMTAWNKVADPRAFEYAAKSVEDRAAMRAKMSPADQASLKANIQQLHAMGVSP